MAQFTTDKEGEWMYIPEYDAKIYPITNKEYNEYVSRFKRRLAIETILSLTFIGSILYWLFFVHISMGFFMWGIVILMLFGYDSYTSVHTAFYQPQKALGYKRLYGLAILGIMALIGIANYFQWSLTREETNAFIGNFFEKLGLKAPLEKLLQEYPHQTIGVFIIIFLAIRFRWGIQSQWFRPASRKTRRIAKEDTVELQEEKDWELYKKNMNAKLNPKKSKKKKKKEFKKLGKVKPKKYKGETTNE